MRMGVQARLDGSGSNAIDELLRHARVAGDFGLQLWMGQGLDLDALTALAIVAREVPHLEVGVAVVPVYTRHPIDLAVQVLTAQAATGNRFTLGVGVSHKPLMEGVYGLPYNKPIRQMREFLEILVPLLHDGILDYAGEALTARTRHLPVRVQGAPPPKVLVAALSPQMLNVAARLADGTALWMVGPRTLGDDIVPTITKAAEAASRPRPDVVVGLPVCVTSQPDDARAEAGRRFALYKTLPAYQATLAREGVDGPGDLAVVGNEEDVATQIHRLAEIGATGGNFTVFGSDEEKKRALALLAELAGST